MASKKKSPKKHQTRRTLTGNAGENNRRSAEQEYKWQIKLLKDRIYKYEHKQAPGYKVDVEALFADQQIDVFDENDIERIKQMRGRKFFETYSYDPNVSDDIFTDYYDNYDPEPVRIEDAVIDRLFEFVYTYQPNIGIKASSNRYKTLVRRIARRQDDLLTFLEDRINEVGKANVAMAAEDLQSAENLCVEYMVASDDGDAGRILMDISKLVFGRASTFTELKNRESYEEMNGRYG